MLLETEIIARLIAAAVLGAVIGLERQLDAIPAGFRTHMLICMGACLFTIISFEFAGPTDPSRIAAGIVTGIGLLCAGAIFKQGNNVHGLTTAADLWVVTAIGMAVGMGAYLAAGVTAILVVIILSLKKLTQGKV